MQSVLNEGKLDEEFNCLTKEEDLYSYVRIEDISRLRDEAGLESLKVVAQDGASDYIRPVLNKMSEKEFQKFVDYQIKNSARPELLGASSHVMDVLIKV